VKIPEQVKLKVRSAHGEVILKTTLPSPETLCNFCHVPEVQIMVAQISIRNIKKTVNP
jgi:hypothetical protein